MGGDYTIGVRRNELLVRANIAVKQGSPPPLGRGKDPSRYSNEELSSFLESIYWGRFDELSKDDLVSYAKRAMKEGAPQLVEHGKFPGKYPENQLRAFLRVVCCKDISELSKDDLVVRCKIVTEQGAPSITNNDDDLVTCSREELINHLDGIREAELVTEVPDPKGPAKGGGLGNPGGMPLIEPMLWQMLPQWDEDVAVARLGDAAMCGRHSGKRSAGISCGTSVAALASAQLPPSAWQAWYARDIFLHTEEWLLFTDHQKDKKRRCA